MAGPPLLLGIDVGTGGAKAILVDTAGHVHANLTTEYPLSTPKPLWSEQDPEDWWRATVESIKRALAEANATASDVVGIGLTGQMHGLVLLDRDGTPLRPAILWNDGRTGAECAEIHRRVGVERVIDITGKPALTGFTAPKILWVKEHEPEVFRDAATMFLPKDYVRYRLTGARVTDVADASGTSLFDVERRTWSADMVDALKVPPSWLPDVMESPDVSGTVTRDASALTGLREGTPVAAGAGDQAAEAIGCGIVDDGAVSVTIGTSGVVFASMSKPHRDPEGRLHTYAHASPGLWHVMGVMLSAGGSFRWYRDTFGAGAIRAAADLGIDSYDVLIEGAAEVPPGSEGLVFLPYLTGERTPHPDPHAKGAFVGITLRHDQRHFTRAVMEGVTFGLMDGIALARAMGIPVERARVSGGGARSPLWRQMMADIFGSEIATVNVSQGAAFGAALLGGVCAGVYDDVVGAARSVVRETSITTPGAEQPRYAASYDRYRALYPALRTEFEALTAVATAGDSVP